MQWKNNFHVSLILPFVLHRMIFESAGPHAHSHSMQFQERYNSRKRIILHGFLRLIGVIFDYGNYRLLLRTNLLSTINETSSMWVDKHSILIWLLLVGITASEIIQFDGIKAWSGALSYMRSSFTSSSKVTRFSNVSPNPHRIWFFFHLSNIESHTNNWTHVFKIQAAKKWMNK